MLGATLSASPGIYDLQSGRPDFLLWLVGSFWAIQMIGMIGWWFLSHEFYFP